MTEHSPTSNVDIDIADYSAEALIAWLYAKYQRHGEMEDLKAAQLLQQLTLRSPEPSAALVEAFRAGAHYGDSDDYDPLDTTEEARAYAQEILASPYVMKPSEEAAMFKAVTKRERNRERYAALGVLPTERPNETSGTTSMAGGKGADATTAATEPVSRPSPAPSLPTERPDPAPHLNYDKDTGAVSTDAAALLKRAAAETSATPITRMNCPDCDGITPRGVLEHAPDCPRNR